MKRNHAIDATWSARKDRINHYSIGIISEVSRIIFWCNRVTSCYWYGNALSTWNIWGNSISKFIINVKLNIINSTRGLDIFGTNIELAHNMDIFKVNGLVFTISTRESYIYSCVINNISGFELCLLNLITSVSKASLSSTVLVSNHSCSVGTSNCISHGNCYTINRLTIIVISNIYRKLIVPCCERKLWSSNDNYAA